jgi:hypothetical protein
MEVSDSDDADSTADSKATKLKFLLDLRNGAYGDDIDWKEMEVSDSDDTDSKATKLKFLLDLAKGTDYWLIPVLKSQVEDKIPPSSKKFIDRENVIADIPGEVPSLSRQARKSRRSSTTKEDKISAAGKTFINLENVMGVRERKAQAGELRRELWRSRRCVPPRLTQRSAPRQAQQPTVHSVEQVPVPAPTSPVPIDIPNSPVRVPKQSVIPTAVVILTAVVISLSSCATSLQSVHVMSEMEQSIAWSLCSTLFITR